MPCVGKRLAGEAAGEDVDLASPLPEVGLCDVFITYGIREPVFQDRTPEGIDLAVEGVIPAQHGGRHFRAADAGE